MRLSLHCCKSVHKRLLSFRFCFILIYSFTRLSVVGQFGIFYTCALDILLLENLKCFLLLTSLLLNPQTGLNTLFATIHTKVALSNMIFTRHVWPLNFQVKVIKIKYNYKVSSLVTLATFQVLNNHVASGCCIG